METRSKVSERKNLKRKIGGTVVKIEDVSNLIEQVKAYVATLNGCTSGTDEDRNMARKATQGLVELAKIEDYVSMLISQGVVEATIFHVFPPWLEDGSPAVEYELEKEAAFLLGLLAAKAEYQHSIAMAGAVPPLISLLKLSKTGENINERSLNSAFRRAADTITNLAHENMDIKTLVRNHGGIPPLVELLDSPDPKVQRAVAGALRTLAFKNEANKNQIVECQALPTLIFLLGSEDSALHYEAVGVIGNLVHSSVNIKKQVLEEGALQPVISLLSSRCRESQREAALLLGQFATEPECKVRIVQRGAVGPLIKMLEPSEPGLQEMAAFALGRLAQNTDNQAGICQNGGLRPILELMDCRVGSLQHNAAFALYGLVDNEDNICEFIREGGVQRLLDCELMVQATKDCVQKTLKRLEEKLTGKVLRSLMHIFKCAEKSIQRRVITALAHLCNEDHQRVIFVNQDGLDFLLEMLEAHHKSSIHKEGALALFTLAKRAAALSPIDAAPAPPTPQVYLGEKYVNNPVLSDVTFLVEGKKFHAHRIALLSSSDAFRAMFDGGYREKEAKDVEIPNISFDVFEAMMKCIYTGSVDVNPGIAEDLLRAADQYLLEGLKRICEFAIAEALHVGNVANIYDLAETFHAESLGHKCILFVLEKSNEVSDMPGYEQLIRRMLPEMKEYFHRVLRPIPF